MIPPNLTRRWGLLTLLLWLWVTPGLARESPLRPGAVDEPHRRALLLEKLDATRKAYDISALGLVIVSTRKDDDGSSFIEGLGTIAHGDPAPIGPETVFRLGSITKGFTAGTFMRLAERGEIGLNDHLDQYLDPTLWRNPWAEDHPVTLAALLEHSAGFPDMSSAEFDSQDRLTLSQALSRYAGSHQVRWPPGQWHSYSNLNAGLAGLAAEQQTGESYEALVRREVLEPLGMRDTGFDPARVAVTGYDRDGHTPIPYWHIVYRPSGGLNASLKDMARYLRWHLNRGQLDGKTLLTRDSMIRMETPRTTRAARAGLTFGYGLGNYSWLHEGILFHCHGGDADGFLSRFGYSHELGRGYFLVINAFQGKVLREMRVLVERFLIGDVTAGLAPPLVHPEHRRHAWVQGRYGQQTRRFGAVRPEAARLRLTLADDGILSSGETRRQKWFITEAGDNRLLLRAGQENRATAVVARDDDGSVFFVSEAGNYLKQPED